MRCFFKTYCYFFNFLSKKLAQKYPSEFEKIATRLQSRKKFLRPGVRARFTPLRYNVRAIAEVRGQTYRIYIAAVVTIIIILSVRVERKITKAIRAESRGGVPRIIMLLLLSSYRVRGGLRDIIIIICRYYYHTFRRPLSDTTLLFEILVIGNVIGDGP